MIDQRALRNGQTVGTLSRGSAESEDAETHEAVEVLAKSVRRQFTSAYKLSILEQAEACAPGELGALLRWA